MSEAALAQAIYEKLGGDPKKPEPVKPPRQVGDTIIHYCAQGTSDWFNLRAGIPTASCFDKIITPGGNPSKSAEPYMFRLLAERIMGHPVEEFTSRWMERGSGMEAEAVNFYQFQRECETEKVGFVTNLAGTIGASPDRRVHDNGEDGLLEIKVPAEHTHMSYLLQSGSAYEEYRVQVQGQLWVTGAKWSDVLSYHPELPPALMRIQRDEKFIEKLSAAVTAFSGVLDAKAEECRAKGWLK
jgi:hypothetical protein